jgi:predicted DNA-binding protein with PD1-like motif
VVATPSGRIIGLGGFLTATLGWGDPANGFAFKKTAIDQKCEVVSLVGNISLRDGKPYVHIHVVVSFSDGSTKGGHLIEAHISPIAEIFVGETESTPTPRPAHIQRFTRMSAFGATAGS